MTGIACGQPARVALVGLHGHGRWHLEKLGELGLRSRVELVGVGDLLPPDDELAGLLGDVPWSPDLDLVLAREPEIVILCTPIHTHVELGRRVAGAGCHLLLEKPTAPSLAAFDELVEEVARAGIACQVGYQALGSGAVAGIGDLMAGGAIGELIGIGGACVAVREAEYYQRADWAGRRRLSGRPGGEPIDVVDGALTNPFVHAVAAALRIAGAEEPGQVVATELELCRANDIEADDTSVARLGLAGGKTIVVAATTCAPGQYEPYLVVHGTAGRIIWPYKGNQVVVEGAGPPPIERRVETYGSTDLLENLIDHLTEGVPLLVPIASTRAVTAFVDSVRRAPDPVRISSEHLVPAANGSSRRPVVVGVDRLIRRAADELATFTELGAPWARPGVETLEVAGHDVAHYQLGSRLPAELAPRPFLHPVRTLAGTIVTDREPPDHPWHLGAGMALQDVGGTNVWGGRTYVRDIGYLWLDDHGSVRHLEWLERRPDLLAHRLGWFDRRHRCLLVEDRTVAAVVVGARGWALRFRSELRNVSALPLKLGSPGSNGRDRGGYGGFFWRLPRPGGPEHRVWTEHAEGETQVHGTVSPWLAWTGTAAPDGQPFTLVAAPGDERTAVDPWFVRSEGYPGFGSAVAWERPVDLEPGERTDREIRVLVADTHLDDHAAVLCADIHAAFDRSASSPAPARPENKLTGALDPAVPASSPGASS